MGHKKVRGPTDGDREFWIGEAPGNRKGLAPTTFRKGKVDE